jgi:hypothetical protein
VVQPLLLLTTITKMTLARMKRVSNTFLVWKLASAVWDLKMTTQIVQHLRNPQWPSHSQPRMALSEAALAALAQVEVSGLTTRRTRGVPQPKRKEVASGGK